MAKIIIEVKKASNCWIARIIQKGNKRIGRQLADQREWVHYGDNMAEAVRNLVYYHPKLFDIKVLKRG